MKNRKISFLNLLVLLSLHLIGQSAYSQTTWGEHPVGSALSWSSGYPTLSDNATIDADYSISSDFSVNELTVNSGKTLTINGGYNFNVNSKITNNGTIIILGNINIVGSIEGIGSIEFKGPQSYTIPKGTYGELILDCHNDVKLAGHITVTSNLEMISSDIKLGDYNLKLTHNDVLNNYSHKIYTAPDKGKLIIGVSQTYNSLAFPICDIDGDYAPINIEFTEGQYNVNSFVSVGVSNVEHPDINEGTNNANYIKRYWDVQIYDISNYKYSFTCTYDVNDLPNNITSSIYAANRASSGSHWFLHDIRTPSQLKGSLNESAIISGASPNIISSDFDVLVKLYKLANDDNWLPSSNVINNFSPAITIGGTGNKKVTAIDLSNKGLNGELPSEINSLDELVYLNLSNNSLDGSFPDVSSLSITDLYLNNNSFTNIDGISGLNGSLKNLQIQNNNLYTIPDFSNFNSLDIGIYLDNNYLTFGDIKQSLSNIERYSPQKNFAFSPSSVNFERCKNPSFDKTDIRSNYQPLGETEILWFKEGSTIPIATTTLNIKDMSDTDEGKYFFKATNPDVSYLILESGMLNISISNNSPEKVTFIKVPDFNEDAKVKDEVGSLDVIDDDKNKCGEEFTYYLSDDNNGNAYDNILFRIEPNTNTVELNSKLDADIRSTYSICVEVVDKLGASAKTVIPITVDYTNDSKPEFTTSIFDFTILEVNNNRIVGTVTATDNDVTAPHKQIRYSLSEASNLFDIDPNTGEINLKSGVYLDCESKAENYTLGVIATDVGNSDHTDGATIKIIVENENDEAPRFDMPNSNFDFYLPETPDYRDIVTTIQYYDPDQFGIMSCNIISGNEANLFKLEGFKILVENEKGFDVDANNATTKYTLGIQLFDGKHTDNHDIIINITPTNDIEATLIFKTIEVNEEQTFNPIPIEVVDNDRPIGENKFSVDLKDGTGLYSRFEVVDIPTPHLQLKPGEVIPDCDLGFRNFTLSLIVNDLDKNDNIIHSTTGIYSFSIKDVNDNPPVLADYSDFFLENQTIAPIDIIPEDLDIATKKDITFTLTNAATTPFDLTNNNDGTATLTMKNGYVLDCDPFPYETIIITVNVLDGNVYTTSAEYTFVINQFNEFEPTIINQFTIPENDGTYKIKIFDDKDGDNIVINSISGNHLSTFIVNSQGEIEINNINGLDHEKYPYFDLDFEVMHNGETVPRKLKINIDNKNDEIPTMEFGYITKPLPAAAPPDTPVLTFNVFDDFSTSSPDIIITGCSLGSIPFYASGNTIYFSGSIALPNDNKPVLITVNIAETTYDHSDNYEHSSTKIIMIPTVIDYVYAPLIKDASIVNHIEQTSGLVAVINGIDQNGVLSKSSDLIYKVLNNSDGIFTFNKNGLYITDANKDKFDVEKGLSVLYPKIEVSIPGNPHLSAMTILTVNLINIDDTNVKFTESTNEVSKNNEILEYSDLPTDGVVHIISFDDGDDRPNDVQADIVNDDDRILFEVVKNNGNLELRIKDVTSYLLDYEKPNMRDINVEVKLWDGSKPDGVIYTYNITLENKNDNRIKYRYDLNNKIYENFSTGGVLMTFHNTDPDGTTLVAPRVTFTGGNDNEIFGFDENWNIILKESLNYESIDSYILTVNVQDGIEYPVNETIIYLDIKNINESPPTVQLTPNEIPENTVGRFYVGTFTMTDDDKGDNVSLISLNNSKFVLEGENLYTANDFVVDYETNGYIDLEICFADTKDYYGNVHSACNTHTINIGDINDEKPMINVYTFNLLENAIANPAIGDLKVSDEDVEDITNGIYTFEILGEHKNNFSFIGNSIVNSKPFDADNDETEISFTVIVYDLAGNKSEKEVTVYIAGVDDEIPVFIGTLSGTISENTTGSPLTLTATDKDTDNSKLIFSKIPDSFNYVTVEPNGEVIINTERDFEAVYQENPILIGVTVTDETNSESTAIAKINIDNIDDESPVITILSQNSINEDAPQETNVCTFNVIDMDSPHIDYRNIEINNFDLIHPLFKRVGNKIVIDDNYHLNYESTTGTNPYLVDELGNKYVQLKLTVRDGTNASTTKTVKIELINTNNNDPYIYLNSTTNDIDENPINGELLFKVETIDDDNNSVNLSIGQGSRMYKSDPYPYKDIYTFNYIGGEWWLTVIDSTTIDAEEITFIELPINLSNGMKLDVPSTITITYNNINDNDPEIDVTEISLNEYNSHTGDVPNPQFLVTSDSDGNSVSCEINYSYNNDFAKMLIINSATNEISVKPQIKTDFDRENILEGEIKLILTDNGIKPHSRTSVVYLTVKLTDVNDKKPVVNITSDITIDEYVEGITNHDYVDKPIFTVNITDEDITGTETFVKFPDDYPVRIDGDKIYIKNSMLSLFDYEATHNYIKKDINGNIYMQLEIDATDGIQTSTKVLFKIYLNNVNDHLPEITNPIIRTDEHPLGSKIGDRLSIVDIDGDVNSINIDAEAKIVHNRITYNYTDVLEISDFNVIVKNREILDFEEYLDDDTSYIVVPVIINHGFNSSDIIDTPATLTIAFNNIGDNDPEITEKETTVNEYNLYDVNAASYSISYELETYDKDNEPVICTIDYSYNSDMSGNFEIVNNTVVLIGAKEKIDAEISDKILLRIGMTNNIDAPNPHYIYDTLTINIANVNDNLIHNIQHKYFTIDENPTIGDSLTTILPRQDNDKLSSLPITYDVIGDTDKTVIGFSQNSNKIEVLDPEFFDHETRKKHNFVIRLNDMNELFYTFNLMVDIDNVNEDPPDFFNTNDGSGGYVFNCLDVMKDSAHVDTVYVKDADGGSLQFELDGPVGFGILPLTINSAAIYVAEPRSIEGKSILEYTVIVSDTILKPAQPILSTKVTAIIDTLRLPDLELVVDSCASMINNYIVVPQFVVKNDMRYLSDTSIVKLVLSTDLIPENSFDIVLDTFNIIMDSGNNLMTFPSDGRRQYEYKSPDYVDRNGVYKLLYYIETSTDRDTSNNLIWCPLNPTSIDKCDVKYFKAFPNPCLNSFTVEINSLNTFDNTSLYLFDSSGKLLKSKHKLKETSFDIELLKYKGKVFFLLISDGTRTYKQTIIKE